MRAGALGGRFALPCAAAAAIAVVELLVTLLGRDFLPGFDAYYYAVQADFLAHTGRLRIPDSGLVHYAIAALTFCGLSAENAVRAWTACSLALFYATLLLLLRRCRSRSLAVCLFAWALASPTILFLAVEFPKNFSFLIAFAAWFLFIDGRHTRLAPLAALVCLAALLHKSALVYAGVAGCALLLPALAGKIPLPPRRLLVAAGCVAAFFLLWALFATDAPHRADLLRLKTSAYTPGIIALLGEKNLPSPIQAELIFALIVFCIQVCLHWGKKKRLLLPALLTATVAMPAFGTETFNFGERFALLCPFLVLLSCFLLYKDEERRFPPRSVVFALLPAAVLCAFARLPALYPPERDDSLRAYAAMTEALAPKGIPLLIVHRGMHFYYKYHTGRDAFSFEPEKHWDKTRIRRLAWGLTDDEWQAHLPAECGWSSGRVAKMPAPGYTLIREDCWNAARRNVNPAFNPDLYDLMWNNPMNPSAPRPTFLYKKHTDDGDEEFPAIAPTGG